MKKGGQDARRFKPAGFNFSMREFLQHIKKMNRDVKIVILSVFLFAVGYSSVIYYFPLLLKQLGAAEPQIGFIYSMITAVAAVSALSGGFLIGRVNLRKFIVAASMLLVPFSLIMFFAADWKAGYAAGIFDALSYAVAPAYSTLVHSRSARDRVGLNFGIFSSSFSAGAAFAPAIGGLLAEHFGLRAPFLFSAVVLALSSIVCLWLSDEKDEEIRSIGFKEAVRTVRKNRKLVVALVAFMFLIFMEYLYDPFLSLYLREIRGFRYDYVGYFVAVIFLINIFGSPVIGRLADRKGTRAAIGVSMAGYSAGLFALVFIDGLAGVIISLLLVGIFKQVYTLSSIATARNTGSMPPHVAYSALHFFRSSLSVFAPAAGGWLAGVSLELPIIVVAGFYLLTAVVSVISLVVLPGRRTQLD